MITENLSTLKIHKLTKEQYERERLAGRIDETALYLTPDNEGGGASQEQFDAFSAEVEAKYETKTDASTKLDTAKSYTDGRLNRRFNQKL